MDQNFALRLHLCSKTKYFDIELALAFRTKKCYSQDFAKKLNLYLPWNNLISCNLDIRRTVFLLEGKSQSNPTNSNAAKPYLIVNCYFECQWTAPSKNHEICLNSYTWYNQITLSIFIRHCISNLFHSINLEFVPALYLRYPQPAWFKTLKYCSSNPPNLLKPCNKLPKSRHIHCIFRLDWIGWRES